MSGCTRRSALVGMLSAGFGSGSDAWAADPVGHAELIAAALRMKQEAIESGDQPYGAVVARDGRVVGWGPSRVVSKRDPAAHAEREAIRAAQAALGSNDLSGCVLYSTSRPCHACERAAAEANVARMIWGPQGLDAGRPR
jgi:tRNA(Arg) A34 adenosine deaminase TadA